MRSHAVYVSGDTLVIGLVFADTASGPSRGAAYIYARSGSTWTQQQKLEAPDGTLYAHFGSSVFLSVDTLVVGAPGQDTSAGAVAGAAYVFTRSGTAWTMRQELVGSDAASYDQFGTSVAVSANTVVAGAPNHGTPNGADYQDSHTHRIWKP